MSDSGSVGSGFWSCSLVGLDFFPVIGVGVYCCRVSLCGDRIRRK